MKNKEKNKPYKEAWLEIREHYLFSSLSEAVFFQESDTYSSLDFEMSKSDLGYVIIHNDSSATLIINTKNKLNSNEWFFVFATMLIVLGLDLYKGLKHTPNDSIKENAIFAFAINYVNEILGIKDYPKCWSAIEELKENFSFKSEHSLYENFQQDNLKITSFTNLNLLSKDNVSIIFKEKKNYYSYYRNSSKNFSEIFVESLVEQAKKTISLRANISFTEDDIKKRNKPSYKAKRWFINHFPLLSALASQFEIIDDIKVCQNLGIKIAAVSAIHKIIYINPLANLNEQGMRFVIAHEILHIALNHASRQQGRDHLIWNLACDFVINHWLVTMNIGVPPSDIFMDKDLEGKSADEIYLLISNNLELQKKMGTLRDTNAGKNKGSKGGDMLDQDPKYFADFEDACKHSLLRGMFLHESIGRGDLPADLVEDIRAINQPAIPWQVELSRWIAEKFPLEESKRTYARASRRQSATPDIPRPRYIRPEESKNTKTFSVVLDTSGSMDIDLLGKCLGAIASYSAAQEVKFIRLVYCDAQPYDEGYISVDILSQKMKVKGRGGTVIQQAINYLEHIEDFPKDAPILILTDGFIEETLDIKREHAFLVPRKIYLPFIPRGPVFEFK